MEINTIQPQMFKVLLDIAIKNKNYTKLNTLIQNVFSQPEILNDSFRIYSNRAADLKHHNVDIPFLQMFYQDISLNSTQLPSGISNCIGKFFQTINNQTQLSKFVKQPQNYSKLRCFFILLYYPIFYETQIQKSGLIRLLKLVKLLSKQQKQCLSHWLVHMHTNKMLSIIQFIHKTISYYVLKLLPEEVEKNNLLLITEIVMHLSQYMKILHQSNQISQKLPNPIFKNKQIMKYFSPNDQFNLHIKKIELLNFINYPFLFDLSYKSQLLQIQNKYQQQKNLEKGLLQMISDQVANQQQVVIDRNALKSLYLQLEVNRNSILDDSINKLLSTNNNQSLKNPLKIKFVGEMGDDAGGVKKEYFQLLIKSIFNENSDMFIKTNNNHCHWFNGLSYQTPIMFEFVGMVLGLSIYNNTLLDLKFPRLVYYKLLHPNNQIQDCLESIKDLDPETQKSLKYILLTKQSLEPLQLTFQASVTHFGQRINYNLVPNGSLIKLTHKNKQEYVSKYCDWVINKHIKSQFESFKKGFYKVVTGDMIKLLSAEQLQKIICGDNTLDFKDLKQGTRYKGYSAQSPVIVSLWEVLNQFSEEQKKAFLSFTTGSDRTPVGGLSSLKLVIQRYTADTENLPNSRTCSNLLLLPEYKSKEKIRRKLLLAMQHKQGFGLI